MVSDNITLSGFMATGKSTIGPILATLLGYDFVDLDQVIVVEVGLSIPEIFERFGESEFRQIESRTLRSAVQSDRIVLATGGGALIDPDNRRFAEQNSFLVCLTASLRTIEERLCGETGRPLAKNWRNLWQQRAGSYGQIARQVYTDGKSPQQVAEEIAGMWQKWVNRTVSRNI